MRSLIKNFVSELIIKKASRLYQSSKPFLILVIGGEERSALKSYLAQYLNERGLGVMENQPGYNHRLGIALTILGQKAGFSSWLKWLQVIAKILTIKSIDSRLIFVVDFNADGNDDLKFIKDNFYPNYLIDEKAINGELVTLSELVENQQGSEVKYMYKNSNGSMMIKGFGQARARASVIGRIIFDENFSSQIKTN